MKAKQQGLLLAGLLIVMALIYAKALKRPRHQENKALPPSSKSVTVIEASEEASDKLLAVDISHRDDQRKRSGELSFTRDPFSKGLAEGQVRGLMLSGILWDVQAPMAIINGQTVRIGEEVEGYHITEITPEHVAVTDGAETFQLQNE